MKKSFEGLEKRAKDVVLQITNKAHFCDETNLKREFNRLYWNFLKMLIYLELVSQKRDNHKKPSSEKLPFKPEQF